MLPVRGKVILMERRDAPGGELVPEPLLVAGAGAKGVPGESIGTVSGHSFALSLTADETQGPPRLRLLGSSGRGPPWTRVTWGFRIFCQPDPVIMRAG